MRTDGFAPPGLRGRRGHNRGVGWGLCGGLGRGLWWAIRGGLGRRRWANSAGQDFHVGAVDERLLLCSVPNTTTVVVAAPAVSRFPPPLHYAVLTRQVGWQNQIDREHSVAVSGKFPGGCAVRLPEKVREFRLGDGRGPDVSDSERESAAVIGGDLDLDRDLLALGVRLGDDLVGVFTGVGI